MNHVDQLRAAQRELGLNNRELARALRVSEFWLSKVFNGHRAASDDLMLRLAELRRKCALEPRTISAGKELVVSESAPAPYGEPMRYVPVVSWAHAGEAVAYEQIAPHDQERVATMSTDPRAFAITVEGESMLPDFKPGDRVIVAPSRVPRNGRPCVVKLADDGVLLRIFHRLDKDTIRVASLRPEIYPGMDLRERADYRWCWPVEELNRRVF